MCSEPILAHGIQAYKDSQAKKRSDAFDTIAMTVIFTTGIVSGCVPMAYNSNMVMLYVMAVLLIKKQKKPFAW